jgi:ribulose-phosphate 3-epimerase
MIRDNGCAAGAAICPATPASALDEVAADSLDLALCMSVNPGWSAQSFIPASLDKLARMRKALPDHVALEVDGGIHEATAAAVVEAGANLLVAGSAVFGSDDPPERYRRLAAAAWGS